MCGICGFNGAKPSIEKIKILSILNETRGKDSCGLSFNNKIYKGVRHSNINDTSESRQFWRNVAIKKTTKLDNNTILFHTRQGTKGAANEANTHPFGYFNDLELQKLWDSGVKKVDEKNLIPEFTLMMNGTLDGLYDLNSPHSKRGYKFTTGDNDSKMLGDILFRKGFDYLAEYEGAAALAFFSSHEPNTLYLWKGASFSAQGVLTEERPLHYYYDKEDKGIYFSSLAEHLEVVANGEEITEMPVNTLIKFKNGHIESQQIIDRKVTKKVTNTYYQGSNHQNYYNDDLLGRGNYGTSYGNSSYGNRMSNKKKTTSDVPDSKGTIIYWEGKYYNDNKLANGHITVTSDMEIIGGKKTLMFKDGIIFQSKKSASCEHIFYNKDKEFINIYGEKIESWKKGFVSVAYIPFDDMRYFMTGSTGRIGSKSQIITGAADNKYNLKYGMDIDVFEIIFKYVKSIGFLAIPEEIFSPYGLFTYVNNKFKTKLTDVLFAKAETLVNAAMLRTVLDNYFVESNLKDRNKALLPVKHEAEEDNSIFSKKASSDNLEVFFKEVGVVSYSWEDNYKKFNYLYGIQPEFHKTIGELLLESKLQKEQQAFFGSTFNLVTLLKTKENYLPFVNGYKNLVDFYMGTDYDKLMAFNECFVTYFNSKKEAEVYYEEIFQSAYDWNKTPEENCTSFTDYAL